ncbi:hypothetical protein IGI49_000887 [Enterococcus sp. AZ071]
MGAGVQMDWLEDQLDKLKIGAFGLKGSLFMIMTIGLILALLAWVFTVSIIVSWERLIIMDQQRLSTWEYLTWQPPLTVLKQNIVIQRFEFVRWGSLAGYLVLYCRLAAAFFVENQVMQPIIAISDGVEQIKSGEFGHPIYAINKDEFQSLTEQINEMRIQLKDSQERIHQLHIEQKKINSAFSHDLRTPLTVIQNNVELIETYYPTGQMADDLLYKSLGKIQSNIQRLDAFSETMKSIQKIDDFEVHMSRNPLSDLVENIRDLLKTFGLEDSALRLSGNFSVLAAYDLYLIMEVFENLLTNAMRYKKQCIEVTLEYQNPYIFLFVKDDGNGFSKGELTSATLPYFSKSKDNHFGLGLTIASSLTEKHGGVLKLANGAENGAIVSAVFQLNMR